MTRKLFTLAAAMLLLGIAGQAQASHIFTTDILVNGTAVATTNTFSDPTIITTVGTPVTFDIGMYGASNTLNITFVAQAGSTLAAPTVESFSFGGGGTSANPIRHTFTRTFTSAGVFDGYFVPNFLVSSPDYRFPGGSQLDNPQIPIRIVVNQVAASPVPEPASIILLATGGIGLVGGAIRRRRARKGLAV